MLDLTPELSGNGVCSIAKGQGPQEAGAQGVGPRS